MMTDLSKLNDLQIMENLLKHPVLISAYFSGYPIFCPKCNSDKIVLFFDLKLSSNLTREWKEKIDNKKIMLSNQWETILEFTPKNYITSDSNPNWVCKKCYDGGVVINE
jgi:hypothetical protein